MSDVPIEVRLALHVLLRHIEDPPGWHNCKRVVEMWLDSLPPVIPNEEAHKVKAEDTPC